jgi:hypothetical protein
MRRGDTHVDEDQLSLFELSQRFQRIEDEDESDVEDGVPVLLVVHEQGGPQ